MDKTRNILFFTVLSFAGSHGLSITISSNGPVVLGANITFTATVNDYNGEKLKFDFYDNLEPQNRHEVELQSNISQWVVEYPRYKYNSGEYTVYVKLYKNYVVLWKVVAEASKNFLLTEYLNGNIVINQNHTELTNKYVFVNQTAEHYVSLPVSDEIYLKQNSSSIVTYWYIDCVFKVQTTGFKLNYTYIDSMENHVIDALVIGNTRPLAPIATTTTTTNTTTTKPESTTTVAPDTTTQVNKVVKRDTRNVNKKSVDDFICNKNNIIPIDESYIYGHYKLEIAVREPVHNVNITGMNWLQHGDLMNLKVKFAGSPPFDYCAQYKTGEYNVTGNETCHMKTRTLSNEFPLIHYFPSSDQHTVLVIIENEIWKQVSHATINIYKVTPHAQLSVIVVPVVFCLLAVTLVVFGVAYYIQNRSRYTVEVADFDFGQQAHLDYKTFVERLRDSFNNAFNFSKSEDTEALTAPSNAYDSMT